MSVEVMPIQKQDLDAVSQFLHDHMDPNIPVADWRRAYDVPWIDEGPDCGYMLKEGDKIVGAHVALYSTRQIEGREEKFCSFAAWAVLPSHRLHSLKIYRKLLLPDWHLIELTPAPHVTRISEKFGFEYLDTRWAVMPSIPWFTLGGGRRFITDRDRMGDHLTGTARQVFEDHRGLHPLHHLLIHDDEAPCHLMYHCYRRKKLPCATVHYISAPETLARHYKALASFMLFRHAALFTIFEKRWLAKDPGLALSYDPPYKKMYRSDLDPRHIDNLYSELLSLAPPD